MTQRDYEERAHLINALLDEYAAGKPLRAVAAEKGYSFSFVHKALADTGLPLRPGGSTKRREDNS